MVQWYVLGRYGDCKLFKIAGSTCRGQEGSLKRLSSDLIDSGKIASLTVHGEAFQLYLHISVTDDIKLN